MWISTTHNGHNVKINSDFVVLLYPDDMTIMLSSGDRIALTEEDYSKIDVPPEEGLPSVSTTRPSELGDLLTKLHNLLGGRGQAKLTTDRKARLTTRLKDFSPEELELAAKNCGSDEFMQGANDNGKRYGTIDYLIRTSANINKWLEDAPKKKGMFG
jgi:hypothetical protein